MTFIQKYILNFNFSIHPQEITDFKLQITLFYFCLVFQYFLDSNDSQFYVTFFYQEVTTFLPFSNRGDIINIGFILLNIMFSISWSEMCFFCVNHSGLEVVILLTQPPSPGMALSSTIPDQTCIFRGTFGKYFF